MLIPIIFDLWLINSTEIVFNLRQVKGLLCIYSRNSNNIWILCFEVIRMFCESSHNKNPIRVIQMAGSRNIDVYIHLCGGDSANVSAGAVC